MEQIVWQISDKTRARISIHSLCQCQSTNAGHHISNLHNSNTKE
uniref:Uncharacterized protein n=1 Tax=Rhizophora mucronata TaxID=61149 RepID=A0A2P2PMK7_RHIMU